MEYYGNSPTARTYDIVNRDNLYHTTYGTATTFSFDDSGACWDMANPSKSASEKRFNQATATVNGVNNGGYSETEEMCISGIGIIIETVWFRGANANSLKYVRQGYLSSTYQCRFKTNWDKIVWSDWRLDTSTATAATITTVNPATKTTNISQGYFKATTTRYNNTIYGFCDIYWVSNTDVILNKGWNTQFRCTFDTTNADMKTIIKASSGSRYYNAPLTVVNCNAEMDVPVKLYSDGTIAIEGIQSANAMTIPSGTSMGFYITLTASAS